MKMDSPCGCQGAACRRTTTATTKTTTARCHAAMRVPGSSDNQSPGPGAIIPIDSRTALWWPERGGTTRSHSEPGSETPQRRWYWDDRSCESRSPPGICPASSALKVPGSFFAPGCHFAPGRQAGRTAGATGTEAAGCGRKRPRDSRQAAFSSRPPPAAGRPGPGGRGAGCS